MMKTPARMFAIGAMLLGLMTSAARADGIVWTASWSATPTQVNANAPGTGYIVLTPNANPLTHQDTSYMSAANVATFSTATNKNPDVFTNKSFVLDLDLKDVASGAQHVFAFTGAFNGTLSKYSSLVSPSWTGTTSQSFVVGNNNYTVSVGPYSWPDVPGSGSTGAISFMTHVAATPPSQNPPGGGTNQTPEPGTLLLSGIGLSIGAFGWLRKRRNSSQAPEAI